MERAVVDVPLGIPAPLVSLKKRVFEQKYNVSFAFDEVGNSVVFKGSAPQVRAAEADLRAVFSRMSDASPATRSPPAATPRTSQLRYATTATPARTSVSRYVAAKGALTHSWSFVNSTATSLIDVDVNEFAYELVRHERQAPARILQVPRVQFMQSFDAKFVATMARVIDTRVGARDGVKVEAIIGRKLFQPVDIEPGRVYSASELQAMNRYAVVKSSWSNVCDVTAPATRELIAALRETAACLGIDAPKEKLTVWLKAGESSANYRSNEVQAKFVRRDGAWERKRVFTLPTPFTVHDVSLANHVSVRAWVYPQGVAADAKWDDAVRAIELRDGDTAESTIFDTVVSFEPPLEIGDGMEQPELKWRSIKSQLEIPFAGLRFKLVTTTNDSVMLKASLPASARDDSMTSGQQFAQLLQQLDAVLEQFTAP